MRSLVYFFVFMFLASCTDNENTPTLAGEYSATFYRTRDNIKVLQAPVTLSFKGGAFSGGGSDPQAPAVCHGKYSQTDDEINFFNECFFTANFDWTLILSGKFTINKKDDGLLLSKEISDGNGDYYLIDITTQLP